MRIMIAELTPLITLLSAGDFDLLSRPATPVLIPDMRGDQT